MRFWSKFRFKPRSSFLFFLPLGDGWSPPCRHRNLAAIVRRFPEPRWHWKLRRKRQAIRRWLRRNPRSRSATAVQYRAILLRHHGSHPPMAPPGDTWTGWGGTWIRWNAKAGDKSPPASDRRDRRGSRDRKSKPRAKSKPRGDPKVKAQAAGKEQ